MQDPVNFSPAVEYSTTQEIAVRLLNNLQTQNTGFQINFDMRATSLPRDYPSSSITEQTTPLISNPWAVFPSNAFIAAAAAATFSMKSASNCQRETESSNNSPPGINPFIEKAISEQALLSLSQQSAPFKCDIPLNQETDSDHCVQSQSIRRNSRTGERGRRSRVVIHQFGDAEDHFSKALRNLHVKSAGEYDLLEGAATTPKRVWKLTNTYDGEEESLDTFISSPYLEAQNIADLAVEKHFEKSLATFHAKQAAAAAAAATSAEDEVTSKASLDLSLPRTRPPFSPSSSSSSHSSSALLSPREDSNGGPSFNPKKKWLAQYGDDEVARTDVGERKNGVWSSDDSAWNVKNASPTNIEQRSKSCPLLAAEASFLLNSPSKCKRKRNLNATAFAKLRKLSRATAAQLPEASLSQRDFLSMTRTISLEIPSIGDSIDFFDDEDEAVMATKSISAQESPVSSPIAASSGFFTDSTYSLDSFNLPVISEAGYLSSNVSVSSIFKARHLAAPRENSSLAKRKERGFFGCESEERNAERCWPIRKRTAFNASDLSCFKRSRSVVDTDYVEHS
nr:conserved hypothetical protein [Hymenolepis microstoma]